MSLILPLAPRAYEQVDQDRVRRLIENALDTLSTFQNPASGGGSGGLRVEVGDVLVGDPITALDFTSGHFVVTETPTGEANIALVTGTVIPGLNADQLDGFDETAFGRLAAARTWTALQTFDGGVTVNNSTLQTTGSGVLRLADPADVTLASTGHAFQIGASSGTNIAMDSNEIMARNNGAVSALNLQADGGTLHVFASVAGTLLVGADVGSGTVRVTGSGRFSGELRSDASFFVNRVGAEPSMRFQRDLTNNPRWDIGRMNSPAFRFVFADDVTPEYTALDLFGAVLRGFDTSSVERWTIGPSGAATGIELGRRDGTAASAFIDFHSGATAVDFDSRILASGGTGVIGGGSLAITGFVTFASAKIIIDGPDATFTAGEVGIVENAGNLILSTRGAMVFDIDNDANGSNVWNWTVHNQASTLMSLNESQELTPVTNNTGSLGTATVRWGSAFVRRLRLIESADASAVSTDHALQIGLDTGANIIMDENEIMARSNGVVSTLNLNADGGAVAIQSNNTTIATGALTIGPGNAGGIISVRTLNTRDFLIPELVNNTGGAATGPIMRTRRARGTDLGAGRTAVQTNDEIGAWAMQGFGATTYFNGAALVGIAAENWTDTAQGGQLNFQTTQIGATGIATRWVIGNAGSLASVAVNTETVINAKRSDAGTVGYEFGSANATGGAVYVDVSTTSGVDFHTRTERGVGTNGIWRFRQTGTGKIEFWPQNTATKFTIAETLVETVVGTDFKIGDLGTFDSADVPTDLQLLVYHAGGVNKWQAESIQFIYNAGDSFVALLADNTSVAALYFDPGAGADSPVGAPPAPVIKVHTNHKSATIQVLASADPDVLYHDGPSFPADFRHFIYEYSLDAFATAGIALATASSDKAVHGRLTVGSTYSYRVRAVDRAGNASANSAVVSVVAVANSETAAYGVLLASEIAVDRLAALSANIGIITAGQMRNAGNTAGINLGGVGGIPSGWVNTINFENTSIPTGSKFTIDFFRNTIKIKDEQASPITRVELGELDTGTSDWGLLVRGSAGNPTAKLYGADTYLQNDAASPTQGLLVSGSLPGTWTRYVNLTGTGSFLKHERLDFKFDGTVLMYQSASQPLFKLDASDFLLQNDAASPTQGVLIDGTLPGTWTRYLNLNGSGSFLKHEKLDLQYDGDAIFMGLVDITSPPGTFDGKDYHIILRDPDVAHGASGFDTDQIALIGVEDGLRGGLRITVPGVDSGGTGTAFAAHIVSNTANATDPEANSDVGSGVAYWRLTDSGGGLGAGDNALVVGTQTNAAWRLILQGDGKLLARGDIVLRGFEANARVGGRLASRATDATHSGNTTETQLFSHSVPAGLVDVDGKGVRARGRAQITPSGSGVTTFRLKLGGTTVFSVVFGGSDVTTVIWFDVTILRTGATTSETAAVGFVPYDNSVSTLDVLAAKGHQVANASPTWANANTLETTAQMGAAGSGSITMQNWIVEYVG